MLELKFAIYYKQEVSPHRLPMLELKFATYYRAASLPSQASYAARESLTTQGS